MKIDGVERVYENCLASRYIREKSVVDIELIRSLKTSADDGLSFIKDKTISIPPNSKDWTFVFREHYESLRSLIDAFLLFNRIEAERHQCKNACLCFRHPELGLDWEFLETVRLRRNAINYKGKFLSYGEWKGLEPAFEQHITKLRQEIERKLSHQ